MSDLKICKPVGRPQVIHFHTLLCPIIKGNGFENGKSYLSNEEFWKITKILQVRLNLEIRKVNSEKTGDGYRMSKNSYSHIR